MRFPGNWLLAYWCGSRCTVPALIEEIPRSYGLALFEVVINVVRKVPQARRLLSIPGPTIAPRLPPDGSGSGNLTLSSWSDLRADRQLNAWRFEGLTVGER